MSEYEEKEEVPLDKVQFMSIHQSKGLEFSVVVVNGMNEKIFNKEVEEDIFNLFLNGSQKYNYATKNLFDFYRKYYVAFTRAKNILILLGRDKDVNIKFRPLMQDAPSLLTTDLVVEADFKKTKFEKPALFISYTQDIAIYRYCPLRYFFRRKINYVGFRKKVLT